MNINVKALKNQLTQHDIETILTSLNIPTFSKGQTWRLYTGCHHRNAMEGGKNLIYYPQSKSFMCVSQCGCSYDIIGLVQKRLSVLSQPCSFIDAVNYIADKVGIEVGKIDQKETSHICDWEKGLGKFVRAKRGESTPQTYDSSILSQLDTLYPQSWIDEGITIDTMKKYGIKWYSRCNQICIPCRNKNGELIGIRCRNTDEDRVAQAKYIPLTTLAGTTYKFPTNQVFYNISYAWTAIEQTKTVLLFEGEKSILLADQYLAENNALALYGSQLGIQRRNELLKMGVEKVVLCLDSDFHKYGDEEYEKFEKKIFDFAKMFKGFCKVECVYNNIGLEDFYKASPVDKGKEIWEKLWENREVIE